jgi:hypothetical protein
MNAFEFFCSCEACVNDYPQIIFPWADLGEFDRTSIADLKKKFKKNCKTIAENPEKSSKLNVVKLIVQNEYFLATIAKSDPFVFGQNLPSTNYKESFSFH